MSVCVIFVEAFFCAAAAAAAVQRVCVYAAHTNLHGIVHRALFHFLMSSMCIFRDLQKCAKIARCTAKTQME